MLIIKIDWDYADLLMFEVYGREFYYGGPITYKRHKGVRHRVGHTIK